MFARYLRHQASIHIKEKGLARLLQGHAMFHFFQDILSSPLHFLITP
jgi:hypothetical protein